MDHRNRTAKIQFTRVGSSPLLEPDQSLSWESGGIFAPAIIRENNTWKMLYRAYGKDKIFKFGYAESHDGIKWQKHYRPRVVPDKTQLEYSGIEDPRAVKLDDRYLISYTAYANRVRFVKTRIRILETTDFYKFRRITPSFKNHWRKNDKDGVLFPEKINGLYYMLHRLEPNIQISSSVNLRRWRDHATILSTTNHEWESLKIGAGAPPIKTDIGWLLIYHGVNEDLVCSMGAAILDAKNPTKILYRLPFSLLSPEASYERHGVVPNVVFGTSMIEIDNEYRLYYGAGDKVIAAATINKRALLEALLEYPAYNDRV